MGTDNGTTMKNLSRPSSIVLALVGVCVCRPSGNHSPAYAEQRHRRDRFFSYGSSIRAVRCGVVSSSFPYVLECAYVLRMICCAGVIWQAGDGWLSQWCLNFDWRSNALLFLCYNLTGCQSFLLIQYR